MTHQGTLDGSGLGHAVALAIKERLVIDGQLHLTRRTVVDVLQLIQQLNPQLDVMRSRLASAVQQLVRRVCSFKLLQLLVSFIQVVQGQECHAQRMRSGGEAVV